MSEKKNKNIGIIGYGQIGVSLCEMLSRNSESSIGVNCVLENDPGKKIQIPTGLVRQTLDELLVPDVDLVVEAAHPKVVATLCEQILKKKNLLIMSISALGDPDLERRLRSTALKNGTKLYIPHGATLGLDGLRDGLSIWEEVAITMRKNPQNLNFEASPSLKPAEDAAVTVLYDGPTRGVLALFPKNVNSHATLALATLGMDKTRSILIADPDLKESIIEIDAKGGGTSIHIERRNPIKGVTGKLTILSVLESIKSALGSNSEMITC